MNAKPYPGVHAVGGATRPPREALADEAADPTPRLTREFPAARPAHAARAALAWHANQAIAHQVSLSYTLAELARQQGQAVVAASEQGLPAGPWRAAIVSAGQLEVQWAENLARLAIGFGRRFGHLAFAFPGAGATGQALAR